MNEQEAYLKRAEYKQNKREQIKAERELEREGRGTFLINARDSVPKRPRSLWADEQGRGIILPLGEISVLNGRGGLAKSTLLCWIAAQVTIGKLNGEYLGIPKSVIMDMREDDWDSITVPRLIAAGADMSRIYQASVMDMIDQTTDLPTFPNDAVQIAQNAASNDVALYCLDPMPSSMAENLSQDKAPHVRRAFQPLMREGRAVDMSTLGICHNRKDDSNPVTAISGAAFRDLSRAVLSVIPNPEDGETNRKMLGITKSNYGRDNLPARYYDVEEASVRGRSEFEHVPATKIVFGGESSLSIADAMEQNADTASSRGAATECKDWLEAFMDNQPGREAKSTDAMKIARAEGGFTPDQLRTARKKLKITAAKVGTAWIWRMP